MSRTLYRLQIADSQTEDHFIIGLFSSRETAQQTGERYLREVIGFCEHPCTYAIRPLEYTDASSCTVFFAVGWNETADGGESDVVEGDLCSDRDAAERQMRTMQQTFTRAQWTVSQYHIDRCEWQDGFIRAEA